MEVHFVGTLLSVAMATVLARGPDLNLKRSYLAFGRFEATVARCTEIDPTFANAGGLFPIMLLML